MTTPSNIPAKFAPFYQNFLDKNISPRLEQEFKNFLMERLSHQWWDSAEDTLYDCPYIRSIREKKSDEADIRYFEHLEAMEKDNKKYKEEVKKEEMEKEVMNTKLSNGIISVKEHKRWMQKKRDQEQYDDEGFQKGNYLDCLF